MRPYFKFPVSGTQAPRESLRRRDSLLSVFRHSGPRKCLNPQTITAYRCLFDRVEALGRTLYSQTATFSRPLSGIAPRGRPFEFA